MDLLLLHVYNAFIEHLASAGIKTGFILASFPGKKEGEEKVHLVHTVCACAQL